MSVWHGMVWYGMVWCGMYVYIYIHIHWGKLWIWMLDQNWKQMGLLSFPSTWRICPIARSTFGPVGEDVVNKTTTNIKLRQGLTWSESIWMYPTLSNIQVSTDEKCHIQVLKDQDVSNSQVRSNRPLCAAWLPPVWGVWQIISSSWIKHFHFLDILQGASWALKNPQRNACARYIYLIHNVNILKIIYIYKV